MLKIIEGATIFFFRSDLLKIKFPAYSLSVMLYTMAFMNLPIIFGIISID